MEISASTSNTTSFRWPIPNFQKAYNSYKLKFSDNFPLNTLPTFQFALLFNSKLCSFQSGFFGVELKQSDSSKTIELNVAFWLENKKKQKFNKFFYEKQVFNKFGDNCGFSRQNDDQNLLVKLYNKDKTLFLCCELSELNVIKSIDYNQTFLQTQWTLYEQEIHDAIIKVCDVEFKVMKAFFMAQSDVFKQMFQSKFKEGITSTVEIKDFSENAMKAFVKWIYTQQIEDENLIEDLFAVADKYQIQLLKTICIDRMANNLNNENVLIRFALANLYSNNYLKNVILDHIKRMSKKKSKAFFKSPKWIEFNEKNAKAADEILKTIREE